MGSNNITTTGKVLFSNVYSVEGDLPSATTYHGMFAHVHGTAKAYFAHGGSWKILLDRDASWTDMYDVNTVQTTTGTSVNGGEIAVYNGGGYYGSTNSNKWTAAEPSAITVGNATNAVNFTSTSQDSQFNSIGVGTAASTTSGEIRATHDVTAYYSSDANLKTNVVNITNALEKVQQIRGVEFDWKQEYIDARGGEDDYFIRKHDVGVIAQEVEAVLPEVVGTRADGTKAVKYDRITSLLIEAIKEQQSQIDQLKAIIEELKNK